MIGRVEISRQAGPGPPLRGFSSTRRSKEWTLLFKQSVTRVAVLSLVLAVGVASTVQADGPPAKRPAPVAKKSAPAAKKPAAPVRKLAGPAPETPKAIVERACVACHDLGTVTQAKHTAKAWPGVVMRMRNNGADLTDAEIKQVQDYLIKTYAVAR